MKKIVIGLVAVIFSLAVYAQSSITFETKVTTSGPISSGKVQITVLCQGIQDVAAVSLKFKAEGSFAGLSPLKSIDSYSTKLQGALVDFSGGFVTVGWYDVNTVDLTDTIISIIFSTTGIGYASLIWELIPPGANEIAIDINGNLAIVQLNWVNSGFSVSPLCEISGYVYYWDSTTTMPNVSMTWTGGFSQQQYVLVSDSNGHYKDSLPGDAYHIIVDVPDTTNKGLNSTDALSIVRHFVKIEELTGMGLQAADFDGSGGVNSTDALAVMNAYIYKTLPNNLWFLKENAKVAVNYPATLKPVIVGKMGDVNKSYSQ